MVLGRLPGFHHLSSPVIKALKSATTRYVLKNLAGPLLETAVRRIDPHPIEIMSNRALWRRNGHSIIVKYNKELAIQGAGTVKTLHGNTIDD